MTEALVVALLIVGILWHFSRVLGKESRAFSHHEAVVRRIHTGRPSGKYEPEWGCTNPDSARCACFTEKL